MRRACKTSVSAFWSTIGPRAVLIRNAVGFISASRSALTIWCVSRRQRTAHRENVGAAEQVLDTDEFDAEFGRDLLVCIGIMGDEFHVERLRHAEHLGADVADAERAQACGRPGRRPYARSAWRSRLRPRASARSLVSSLPVSASMKVMTETATGRRTPSGVMTSAIPAFVQASTSTVS